MSVLSFKTTIQCAGCVSKVGPILDAEKKINNWNVDLESADRVLTVETATLSKEEVQATVNTAGFQATPI